jgi:glycosyltransferase involved in cell wall biosynthesis
VSRAFALDTARDLSIFGSHLQAMALPDRWLTWWPAAVAMGAALIRKHRPEAIWSTYPISTAHLIGSALHRWSGLPWVADFRDPMISTNPVTGKDEPADPLLRRTRAWVENHTIKHCTKAVFTTPGTLATYANRFPQTPEDRWYVIPNGYDEEDFESSRTKTGVQGSPGKPVVLIHSGDLYRGDVEPSGRDPLPFLKALGDLRRAGKISSSTLKVILRATSEDDYFRSVVTGLDLQDIVSIEPRVSHKDAVAEMLEAHGLLLMQGTKFNNSIPAKLYEYLRAGRPILALTDPAGDTAALLKAEGIHSIVPLESQGEIADGLVRFLDELNQGHTAPRISVERHSRKARTLELATLLDSVCNDAPRQPFGTFVRDLS